MDPEVCLRTAEQAWDDGQLAEVAYHLADYVEWIAKGGFHAQDGAARVAALLRVIGDHADDGQIVVVSC